MQIGVVILGIVIVCLMAFGMRGFFVNPNIHLALRVVVGAIGGGVLALVIIGIRRRIKARNKDKTEEAEE